MPDLTGVDSKIQSRRPGSRWLVLATAAVVLLAGLVQLYLGAGKSGITIDEPTHVLRTQGWLSSGWYVPESFLVDGEPIKELATSPYVYGPAFSAVAHGANRLAGNDPPGSVSQTKEAWRVRHLISALVAMLTTLAVAIAVWVSTRSRLFALWSAAALTAIPIWSGMGFFNPKDTPAAAGYTLLTVGLMLALASKGTGGGRAALRDRLVPGAGIAVMVGFGLFIGAGTRIALWLPLLASLATFAALLLLKQKLSENFGGRLATFPVVVGLVAGMAAIAAVYPSAFSHPIDLISDSLAASSDYPWTGVTLTAGELLGENPPWWYLPTWAFASMPVLILLLALVGGGVFIRSAFWPIFDGTHGLLRSLAGRRDLGIILVLQQALLLSLGSIVLGSNMYTGLRQHLYLVPALAILSGYGSFKLWTRLDLAGTGRRWIRPAVVTLLCAALLVPMAEQLLLFPYNYTYVNPVAGIKGLNGNWETDFWGSSQREALRRVPADQPVSCGYQLPLRQNSGWLIRPGECVDFRAPPFLDERGDNAKPVPRDPARVWVVAGKRAGEVPPEYCRSEDNVTRWLRGEQVVMFYVLRCDRSDLPR